MNTKTLALIALAVLAVLVVVFLPSRSNDTTLPPTGTTPPLGTVVGTPPGTPKGTPEGTPEGTPKGTPPATRTVVAATPSPVPTPYLVAPETTIQKAPFSIQLFGVAITDDAEVFVNRKYSYGLLGHNRTCKPSPCKFISFADGLLDVGNFTLDIKIGDKWIASAPIKVVAPAK